MEKNLSQVLRERMKADGKRFWAGDNISDYVAESDREHLIMEATQAFEQVLDTLLIDRENDPNSQGTAQRLAKMYFNEIMAGRYETSPNATAFPNDTDGAYEGMLVVLVQHQDQQQSLQSAYLLKAVQFEYAYHQ